MKHKITILTAMLLLALAGCQEEQTKKETEPAPKSEQTQSTKPAPTEKPAETAKQPAPQKTETVAKDTETITNDACLAAAKKETGESNIEVTSNEFSQANTLVMLGVGAQRAPWRCLVSNDGQVAELSFEGDDSAGVADQTQSGSDVSAAAVDACLGAVSGQTGESKVSVMSTEFSEANSIVMVGVGEQSAPWRCLVSNDGAVQEVSSQTDEGKL